MGNISPFFSSKNNVSISKIDKEMLDGCLKNDRNSQRKLYEKYAPKMMVICMRYAKTKEDAEDILIDGFVKVFAGLEKFKLESSLETWIHSIMVNASISYFRKNNKHYQVGSIEDEKNDIPNTSDLDGLAHLSGKELINILQKMPEHLKCVFNLVAFEGYNYETIAEELGINVGTARSRMSKGKAWLQERINQFQKLS
jgi:RNA polymerase sigma factor (sigma-70 family)